MFDLEQNGVHVADIDLLRKFQDGFLPLHRDAGNGGYAQQLFVLAEARRHIPRGYL